MSAHGADIFPGDICLRMTWVGVRAGQVHEIASHK